MQQASALKRKATFIKDGPMSSTNYAVPLPRLQNHFMTPKNTLHSRSLSNAVSFKSQFGYKYKQTDFGGLQNASYLL